MHYRVVFLLCALLVVSAEQHTEYLATVHHAPEGYMLSNNKRSINDAQFVGNLIFNNTINENGEVTISLCDITKDLFGDQTKYNLFNLDKSGGVSPIVEAHVKASVDLNVNVDGCLQFYFDPCCETVGLRFILDDPVVLNAVASVEADIEAFNFGISAGKDNIVIDPLSDINLGGFSPVIGSWKLPSILDNIVSVTTSNQQLCAKLALPGNILSLKFCVELQNFTASLYTVNVCPRVTVYIGPQKILDISYTKIVPEIDGNKVPECLALSFIPQCSHAGATVAPDIMQLFKSIDVNNDFKLVFDEIVKSKALLGVYNSKNTNSLAFAQMDADANGEVYFPEFQTYTRTQAQNYESNYNGNVKTTYTPGDVALAVIMTTIATAVVVGIALVAFAQYKGIVHYKILDRFIPTHQQGYTKTTTTDNSNANSNNNNNNNTTNNNNNNNSFFSNFKLNFSRSDSSIEVADRRSHTAYLHM